MSPWFLLAAVPLFALLIIAHEFGHFIAAKWAGIRVEEFGIGFPPRIAGIKRGETLYSINLLPIGGFVRMPGENGETTDESGNYDPGSFAAKSAGKRAIVLLAGVTMNFLLAIVLFTAAEAIGQVVPSSYVNVESGSPAHAAGMVSGDHIISIDGQAVTTFQDIVDTTTKAINAAPPGASTVPIHVVVQRPGASTTTALTVNAKIQGQAHLGVTPDTAKSIHKTYPIWEAPARGIADIGLVATKTVQGIQMVVQGIIPVNQAVTGPVGIVRITEQTAAAVPIVGWYPLLFLAAFISLNLAVFNVLPIPALDGGRLMFIVIEVLRRGKRVSPEREGLVNLIGMAALLFLILLVTINDVSTIFTGH